MFQNRSLKKKIKQINKDNKNECTEWIKKRFSTRKVNYDYDNMKSINTKTTFKSKCIE